MVEWECGRCGCDVFCFTIVAVLGMHFCDPNQLIATKQRNKLAAVAKKIWGLRRIVLITSLLAPGRATADLADVRGSR